MQKFLQRLEDNFKYLIAAILIIVPLYPKFPFIRIPGIYVSVRFEDFLLAFLALVTLVRIASGAKKIIGDKIVRAIAIFMGIGAVSLFSAVFLTKTADLGIGFLHWARRLEYFIPFLAVAAFFPSEKGKNLEFYIKTLALTVIVVFIYGVGQRYLNFPVIITQNEEYSKGVALRWIPGSHINSTFAGHYDLATFLVFILPVFISLYFLVKGRASRIFLLVTSLSGIWLLINSVSRISLVSYLLASALSLFMLKKYKEIAIVIGASVVLSAFSPALFARYQRIIEVIFKSLAARIEVMAASPTPTPVPVFEDRSTSIRLNVEWPRALRAAGKNTILGTGYSSIGLATDNDYLRALGEVGILGLSVFILLLSRVGRVLTSAYDRLESLGEAEKGFVAGITGGFVGVLINAVFIDVFEASKFAIIFWLLIGFAVCLIKEKKNEQNI